MEKKINTILNCCYYTFYALIMIAACAMYKLVSDGKIEVLPPLSSLGQAVQYTVIFYVIISVAGGLFVFKYLLGRTKKPTDERQTLLIKYRNLAIVRICLIGVGAVLGIIAFYWMGGYTSMLWLAGISVIGLYFTKSTLGRMEQELLKDDIQ